MTAILNKYSILYAEDEPNVREYIGSYLQTYFGTIYTAADGKEALDLYNSKKPDVLLLDINLPFIDGLSLAHAIRKKDHKVRILMLSAFTDQDKLLSATELNLTKYLVKPVSSSQFKQAFEKLSSELLEFSSDIVKLSDDHIWNSHEKRLFMKNKEVILTQKERALLELLIAKKNICVTHEDIMAMVWIDQFDEEISKNSVKSQINYLRKKIPHDLIESVYGKGYILKL